MRCPGCSRVNPLGSRFCLDCGTPLTAPPREEAASETLTVEGRDEEFRTGSLLAGRYQVIEELGRGGMGRVYKVLDLAVQEKIALKIISPEIAHRSSSSSRFRNELKLARRINHRNVCRMFDLGEFGGVPFITMEYVPGENLRKIIRMTGPLTAETALSYAGQVCRGLAEAHKLGIVHRDLKPHNIMIDPEGTAKIMDFGLAFSDRGEDLTGPGVRLGTPRYMAPEQVETGRADARSDLYALGLILYEMVTGRPYPPAGSADSPAPPRAFAPSLSPALEAVILKCLERRPEGRYASAEELLGALDALSGPESTLGETPARTSARPSGRRRPRPFVLAALGGALAAGLAAAAFLIFGPSPGSPSIVVLPFGAPGLEENESALASILSDNIRLKLSELSGLKVISRLSSEQFLGAAAGRKEIRRRLGVDQIVTGSLAGEGEVRWLQVSVEAAEGPARTWSRRFAFDPERQFQLENEVVLSLAGELNVPVGAEALESLSLREPSSQEAYRHFRWGEGYQHKYRESPVEADFASARDSYQRAVRLDPGYALAFWGLGNLYEFRYVLHSEARDLIQMLDCYESAFRANPLLAEPYLGRGWARFYEQNFDLACSSFRQALRIHPDNPDVQLNAGSFLRSLGLFREALKFYSAAIDLDLDPLNTTPHILMANCYSWQGEFEKAGEVMRRAHSLDPGNANIPLGLARLALLKGDMVGARREYEAAVRAGARIQPATRLKVWLLAAEGRRQAALDLIPSLDFAFRYEVTNAYCLLGMREEAVANIRRGIELGFRDIKEFIYAYPYLAGNPLFDGLRSHPGFKAVLEAQKRVHLERSRKYGGL